MLSLTRKTDYAIVALSDIARHGATKSSARAIADRTHVPLPVLTNILHQLLHHGLVTSAMGAKGGYALARPPDRISLAEMIDAIEGSFKLTLCCSDESDSEAEPCDLEMNCQIKESVRRVHRSLRHFLNQVTLAQIAFNEVPITINAPAVASCDCAGQTKATG